MAGKDNTNPVATPDMLNAIRAGASQVYQDAVPLATASNLQDVGNPILKYQPVANEFLDAIVNKIVMQLVERRMWDNPLGILKTGDMPLGMDIEDIHINPAAAEAYDGTETGMADILKMHKPDVATAYYRMNRQDKYPVTINNEQLRRAFTAWGKMEDLIGGIVDTLYNGNTIDEYQYTKNLVSGAMAAGKIQKQVVAPVTNDTTGKQFMKSLRTLSTLFTFPATTYNNYKLNGGTTDRVTWAPISDQIIIIRADVASAIGVEVLSSLFNVNYADYLTRQIIVDNFNDETTLALLCDKAAFVIYQQLREFATFFNASSLGWQYYYHAWDLFAMSPFRNCVALTTA